MKRTLSWVAYDFANSSYAVIILAVVFNKFFAGTVAGGAAGVDLHILGQVVHVQGAELFNYLVAISMTVVAIISPFMGALADYSGRRRRYLIYSVLLGTISTAMLVRSQAGMIWWAGSWFILSNMGFAAANVFYNSFLTDLSSNRNSGWISGLGYAAGYLGGGLLLLVNLLLFKTVNGYTEQLSFLTVSVWWIFFSLPAFRYLHDRKPETRAGELGGYLKISARRVVGTLRHLHRIPHFTRFLIAFLFYNDGVETVIIMASIFGAQVLGMQITELILFFLMIQGTALIGALVFGALADRLGHRNVLLLQVLIWSLLLIWAWQLGIWWDPLTEFWILGSIAGTVMGGSQSVSRSLQRVFTPQRHSAEFFGFFAVSGKFATIAGPLLYGLVIHWSGDLRLGILSLILFFLIGGIILLFVNERRGIRDAAEFQPLETES